MYKYSNACTNILKHVQIFKYMIKYSNICKIPKYMYKYSNTCVSIQIHDQIHVQIFKYMYKYSNTCTNI